jgi:hypothetical protein
MLPTGSQTPEKLTEEAAYVLGAWHGDGHERKYGVAFTGNRKEEAVRERIASSFTTAFGRTQKQYEFASRPSSFDMECYGKDFRNWFHEVAGEHHGERVPPVIFQSPRPLVLAFLRGLFDTDGWVNSQNVVGLKMKSRSFLADVQHLLTLAGIDSMLERTTTYLKVTDKTYEGWTLRLRGRGAIQQFHREIGFTEQHKADRVRAHATSQLPVAKDKVVYPVAATFLAVCREHTPYKLISTGVLSKFHYNNQHMAKKTGLVSRGAITYLLEYLDSVGVEDPRADFLSEIRSLPIMRVMFVGPTGNTERVYDIEVGGDHEYASGAFLSHNCERSSDIVTCSWLDDELAKDGKLLLQQLKSRDQKPFDPFICSIYWPCRRLRTLDDPSVQDMTSLASEFNLDDI